MRILITNDDGIWAPGIRMLAEWARAIGEVTVVAPKVEQSGMSHAIQFVEPIEIKRVELMEGVEAWQMDSTPADCVRFGIVGLETAFPLMYTHFVKTGMISMEKLVDIMCYNARERFGLPLGDSFSIWSLDEEFTVDPEAFKSQGRATPFEGAKLFGVHKATVYNGKII